MQTIQRLYHNPQTLAFHHLEFERTPVGFLVHYMGTGIIDTSARTSAHVVEHRTQHGDAAFTIDDYVLTAKQVTKLLNALDRNYCSCVGISVQLE